MDIPDRWAASTGQLDGPARDRRAACGAGVTAPMANLWGFDVDFCVLGSVSATRDGERVPLSGSKINTVLGALLLAKGRPVSYQQLSDYLWGWSPPASMSAQLYTYAYKLRKVLGPDADLTRRHAGYQLDHHTGRFDLADFDTEVGLGRAAMERGDPGEASRRLGAGLDLWQGTPLNNVTEFLADVEQARLDEAFLGATELRVQADLALGRHVELVPELTRLAARYPLREQFRAHLIYALDRCDRRGEALLVYHEARRVLSDELGVDPGPALSAAYQEALEDTGSAGQAGGAPVAAGSIGRPADRPGPTVLPAARPVVGRVHERTRAERVLVVAGDAAGPRRLLISGAAGSGKTTLAVRLAHDLVDAFPDGQVLVEMSDRDGVATPVEEALVRLLRALGHDPGPRRTLRDLGQAYRLAVADRRVLVVLDDVADEHLLEHLAPTDERAALLMTSRFRLSTVRNREVVALNGLELDEGVDLLAEVAGQERVFAEQQAARDIVGWCEHSPVTVRMAGATLAENPGWSVDRLARLLADPERRLDELGVGRTSLREHLSTVLRRLPAGSLEVFCRLAAVDAADVDARSLGPSSAIAGHLRILVGAALVEETGRDADGRARFRIRESVRPLADQMPASAAAF